MNYLKKIILGSLYLPTISLFGINKTEKPNIILILTDQHSYNMLTSHPQGYASTPNIDRLVNNGASFSQAYSANPTSVPARFALFTGKYGGNYKIRENRCESANEGEVRALLDSVGMGNIFQRNGYRTYYGGKVHLPFAKNTSKFGAPYNYGFEEYLTDDEREGLGIQCAEFIRNNESEKPFLLVASFLNPHDICYESTTNLSKQVQLNTRKPEISATVQKMRDKADTYDSLYFYQNIVPDLPVNFAQTEGFPQKFSKKSFCDFPEWYWRKYRWTYAELVSLVDSHIGLILDAIDESPMKDNTIIIFTSDHGEMQAAHHATVKNMPYEECQRIPFVITGKGIAPKSQFNEMVCSGVDLLPTMCELAQIPIPTNGDGVSVAKLIKGETSDLNRNYLYLEGDGFTQVIEKNRYKYTRFDLPGNPEILIDLQTDPGELVNVSEKNDFYRQKTTMLRNYLQEHFVN